MSNTYDDPYYDVPPEKPIQQQPTNYPLPVNNDPLQSGYGGHAGGGYAPQGYPYSSPQPYGHFQQPFYGKPHRGETIIVLGIVSLVMLFLLGGCAPLALAVSIPAWIMGQKDLKEIAAGERDPRGKGNTTAGMIMGIISTVLAGMALVGVVLVVLFYVFIIGIAAAGAAAS